MTSQINRIYLEAAQASCPDGHTALGPAKLPPHFYCGTCSAEWSAGEGHPEPGTDVPEAPDESAPEAQPLRWPYDA